ncbi:hypothetical protein EJ04DRAFT_513303 [Polyplosphaeria fusca]|uniref:Lysine-specific metallo-endopeptidase domain-containing protein n=1 Tax=Polyplosphaeria fusca TaxID=682080 RepID=A0A9P4V2H5_9PLEO|nr:hypothetical protein EJ04DRAFT_513303 [Polyplosphaeria fusca]
MSFGLWCLSILLFARNAFAQSNPNGSSSDDVFITPNGYNIRNNGTVGPLIRLTGWEGCDVKDPCNPDLDKKAAIKKGFEDMQTMIPAWEDVPDPSDPPENSYDVNWEDAAAVEFFGSFQRTGEHRSNVQTNLNMLAQQENNIIGWSLHVRCDDPSHECGGIYDQAYTSHRAETYDHINFCDGYFRLRNLAEALDFGSQPTYRDNIIAYQSKAMTWAHELLHVSWLGKVSVLDQPYIKDELYSSNPKFQAYKAIDTKWLAFSDIPPGYGPANNPNTYAYFTMAKYVMKKKDYYPSSPIWSTNSDPPPRFVLADNFTEIESPTSCPTKI